MRSSGHNEDEVLDTSFTYLVEANITGDGAEQPFAYTGFAYAPAMVGWAWAFTSRGHAQSVNVLFPARCIIGRGMNFVARHVLEASSLGDAVARAALASSTDMRGPKADLHALGQNFNVGAPWPALVSLGC